MRALSAYRFVSCRHTPPRAFCSPHAVRVVSLFCCGHGRTTVSSVWRRGGTCAFATASSVPRQPRSGMRSTGAQRAATRVAGRRPPADGGRGRREGKPNPFRTPIPRGMKSGNYLLDSHTIPTRDSHQANMLRRPGAATRASRVRGGCTASSARAPMRSSRDAQHRRAVACRQAARPHPSARPPSEACRDWCIAMRLDRLTAAGAARRTSPRQQIIGARTAATTASWSRSWSRSAASLSVRPDGVVGHARGLCHNLILSLWLRSSVLVEHPAPNTVPRMSPTHPLRKHMQNNQNCASVKRSPHRHLAHVHLWHGSAFVSCLECARHSSLSTRENAM
jgi:hypothetical protein